MGSMTVRVGYRPIRVGWCVRNDNFADIRSALTLTNTLWGGKFNPIIPVDSFELGSALVRRFNVDLLYPIAKDASIDAFIKRHPHLPWSLGCESIFNKLNAEGEKFTNFADIVHSLNAVVKQFKGGARSTREVLLPRWHSSDPLADVFLASYGAYPTSSVAGVDYAKIVKSFIAVKSMPIPKTGSISKGFLTAYYPSNLTGVGLDFTRARSEDGVFIGSSRSWSDIVGYWNLRAAGVYLIFFDPKYSKRCDPIRKELFRLIRRHPIPRQGPPFRISAWRTTPWKNSCGWGDDINHCVLDEVTWNGMNLEACRPSSGRITTLANVDSDNSNSTLQVVLPQKHFVEDYHTRTHNVVVSLGVTPPFNSSPDRTFWLPPIAEANALVAKNEFYGDDSLRLREDGISFIKTITSPTMSMRAVNVSRLFSDIFAAFGMKAAVSDAGLVCRRLIQQMGGLHDCRCFKVAGVRDLIRDQGLKTFVRQQALKTIGEKGFKKYKQLSSDPRNIFRFLLQRDVFRMGIDVKCPDCHLKFWLPLDRLQKEITCEFCGHRSNLAVDLADKEWAYRCSGLFDRRDNQAGSIAVALTLHLLQGLFQTASLYSTAMEIEPQTALITKCETDFVFLHHASYLSHDGSSRVKMAIGECKTHGEINAQDVERLRAVADAFPEDSVDVYIVFSKLGAFTEAELRLCYAAQREHGQRVIIFGSDQLEDIDKQQMPHYGHPTSLFDLALATQAWFPQPANR